MIHFNAAISIAATVLVFLTYPAEGVIDGADPKNLAENIIGVEKEKNTSKDSERTGRSLHKECVSGTLTAKCIKIHVLSLLEDLSSREELSIIPGLSIVKENQTSDTPSPEEIAAELGRQFPGKPDEKLNRFLMYRLQDYLDGHSLKYRLLDPQTTKDAIGMVKGDKEVTASGEATGRGKGGGGGGLGGGKGGGGLLAAALMMKGDIHISNFKSTSSNLLEKTE